MEEFDISYTFCDLCGNDDTKLILSGTDKLHKKNGYFRIVQCNRCGLVYTNPRPTKESIQYFYPIEYSPHQEDNVDWQFMEIFSKKDKFFNKFKNDVKFLILSQRYGYTVDYSLSYPGMRWFYRLIEWILYFYFKRVYYRIPHWINEGRAFDFGCGSGAYLLMLKNLGWDVVGFDIARIKSRNLSDQNIQVLSGDLDSHGIKFEDFDLATLWHSLEHTHEPLKVLKKINNVLKKGGLIYVEVPNAKSFVRYWFGANWFPWEIPRHLYHFTPRTLKEMLLKAGFEDVKINHLCKKTIFKSLRYWLEEKNIKTNIEHSSFFNFFFYFLIKVFAVFKKSEIVFAVARKPHY
jgi:SAM-dependent methyltransferase